jgi:hypothetical protein
MNLRIIQKWLTAAAENSSQLFSRKPWLKNMHLAGLLALPHFYTFPFEQWFYQEMFCT